MQLTYGDDGMDPVAMEGGEGKPLDLPRLLSKVRTTRQGKGKGQGTLPCLLSKVGLCAGMCAGPIGGQAKPRVSQAGVADGHV